jgi:exopolyphosphatase / guanosine-5'-triphosphate,3'-diphosphate pyrophosphatase
MFPLSVMKLSMQAVVDIGSNSVKISIGESCAGKVILRQKKSWITRLGKNLAANRYQLDEDSVTATVMAFSEMKELFDEHGVAHPIVVATSAVRDCKNPERISKPVTEILGVKLRVLTGQEEARISAQGAIAAGKTAYGEGRFVFLDLGGASTEVGTMNPHFIGHSFHAGAVRCHEELGLQNAPVDDVTWAQAKDKIENYFPMDAWAPLAAQLPNTFHVVAVGGTLMMTAKMMGASPKGEAGFEAEGTSLLQLNEKLRKLDFISRRQLGAVEGREDIVCAGLLCLLTVLGRLKADRVLVTDWGLRHALLANPALLHEARS